MKVLVIGDGGREHALIWRLSQSKHAQKIFCCPGNAGIAELAECINVLPNDFSALIDFIKYEWIDLTFIGQEALLENGIVDLFEREGCKTFGPNKHAAMIGSSRLYTRNFMRLHGIPLADFRVFSSYLPAQDYIRMKGTPLVIKTDSPFVEQGVQIAYSVDEALEALKVMMKDQTFGEQGKQVVIEEYIDGEQLSYIFLSDGQSLKPVSSVRKFMKIEDNPKIFYAQATGAYSPAYGIRNDTDHQVERIMRLFLRAFHSEGLNFKGFLSLSLIFRKAKPYVVEASTFLGDVEGQALLPRIETDFVDVATMIRKEKLSDLAVNVKNETSVCVILFSGGYPAQFDSGYVIKGGDSFRSEKDVFLFHNNTEFRDSDIVTSGGRVLGIAALGSNLKEAKESVYSKLKDVSFDGMVYLKNIESS